MAGGEGLEGGGFEPGFDGGPPVAGAFAAAILADFSSAEFFGQNLGPYLVGRPEVDLGAEVGHEEVGFEFGVEGRIE